MIDLVCSNCLDVVVVEARSVTLPFVCKWCREVMEPAEPKLVKVEAVPVPEPAPYCAWQACKGCAADIPELIDLPESTYNTYGKDFVCGVGSYIPAEFLDVPEPAPTETFKDMHKYFDYGFAGCPAGADIPADPTPTETFKDTQDGNDLSRLATQFDTDTVLIELQKQLTAAEDDMDILKKDISVYRGLLGLSR